MVPTAESLTDDVPWPEAPGPSVNGQKAHPAPQEDLAGRLLPGGAILDEPERPPAVWGDGEDILWAEGESLIIMGPDGVGKTTLAGCLIRARLGLGADEHGVCAVLGQPVAPGKRNVLILLMDRHGRHGARCGGCPPSPTRLSSTRSCRSGKGRHRWTWPATPPPSPS
jgi:hypothetical protein